MSAYDIIIDGLRVLEADRDDILRRLDRLESGGQPPMPPPEPVPPPSDDVLGLPDRVALNRLRAGSAVQIVPVRGKWRVDFRDKRNKPHKGPERETLVAALEAVEAMSGFPGLPATASGVMAREDQEAIGRLLRLGDRPCSVRWERKGRPGTHSEWFKGPNDKPHHYWENEFGLIAEPVAWLEQQRG